MPGFPESANWKLDNVTLLLNIPTAYDAPPASPIRDYLNRNYGDRVVLLRALNEERHWEEILNTEVRGDIAWSSKRDTALWRGSCTGYQSMWPQARP